jgi:hypothetical protein
VVILLIHVLSGVIAYGVCVLSFGILIEGLAHGYFPTFGSLLLSVGLAVFALLYTISVSLSLDYGWRVKPTGMAASGLLAGLCTSAFVFFVAIELQTNHMHLVSFDFGYAMFILWAALSGALGFWVGAHVTNMAIRMTHRISRRHLERTH